MDVWCWGNIETCKGGSDMRLEKTTKCNVEMKDTNGREVHAEFTKEILKERYSLDGLVTGMRLIRKRILKNCKERLWSKFIWLTTGNTDSCVNAVIYFGVRKMRGLYNLSSY
jgi:hypothetical protein